MKNKKRLDVVMVERGLAESRQKAQAVIMAGQVFVDDQKVDKAGAPVTEGQNVEIRGKTLPYVSRGGLKLEKAMQLWPIGLHGAVCADSKTGHRRSMRWTWGITSWTTACAPTPRWCAWSGPMPVISPGNRSRIL